MGINFLLALEEIVCYSLCKQRIILRFIKYKFGVYQRSKRKQDSGRASPYRVPGMEEEWWALLRQAWKRFTHHGTQALEVTTALYVREAMAPKASGNAMGGPKGGTSKGAPEGAEVKQTSLRCCPGWAVGPLGREQDTSLNQTRLTKA